MHQACVGGREVVYMTRDYSLVDHLLYSHDTDKWRLEVALVLDKFRRRFKACSRQ